MYVRNMIISVEFMKISSRLPYPFFLNKILSIFYNVSCEISFGRYILNNRCSSPLPFTTYLYISNEKIWCTTTSAGVREVLRDVLAVLCVGNHTV